MRRSVEFKLLCNSGNVRVVDPGLRKAAFFAVAENLLMLRVANFGHL